MEDKKREKILKKIRALQDKTIAAGCTEEEVEAAMHVLNNLMTEYNLTLEDIEEEYSEYDKDFVWSSEGKTNNNPTRFAVAQLGDFCEVRVWWSKRYDSERRDWRHATTFFGEKKDVELAKYLYTVIDNSIKRAAERHKDYSLEYIKGDTKTKNLILKSFKIGMAQRLSERMKEMVRERSRVMEENQKEGLILRKESDIEKQLAELNLTFGKSRRSKFRNIDRNAAAAGAKAADKVHLGHGLGGGKDSAKMIGM